MEYLVPFGVDPRKFYEGLTAMSEATDKLATEAKTANADLQKAFDTSATASDKLGKSLTQPIQSLLI